MKRSTGSTKQDSPTFGLTRRQFGQMMAGFCTLGLLDSQIAALAMGADRRSMGWLTTRTAGGEAARKLTDIEGTIPAGLEGSLYRTGPGQKTNHGVTLRHLFDGDAYVSGYSFRGGEVSMRSRFVNLPEREEELAAGKMLYSEFGTLPPDMQGSAITRWKNQPSVNIIAWDGRLLGLSEGGHPTAIDPTDLSYQSRWDFYGTLPPFISFTAHPKFDPATGEGFAYGNVQGPSTGLWVFRMNPDGRLTTLHKIPTPGHFMVHDMFVSKSYLMFAVPPVKFDLPTMLSGKATIADALKYFESEPMRLIIARRDGTGSPVTIELPPSVVFHNGNAFEQEGRLILDTLVHPDGSVLEALDHWKEEKLWVGVPPVLTRLTLDPVKGELISRRELGGDLEFPRYDIRRLGEDARFLYTVQSEEIGGVNVDPYGSHIVRHDLQRGETARIAAGPGRAFGEAVFVEHPGTNAEDQGWLLFQGYDAERDENFLEIRDAGTLEFEARAWSGLHFPLGFHGNFTRGSFVSV